MPRNQTKRNKPLTNKPLTNKRTLSAPVLLILFGAVLIVAVLVYLAVSGGQTAEVTGGSSNSNIPYPEVKRISLDDAKNAYDGKTAVFVDTRTESSYLDSHITGALNIPSDQVESSLDKLDPQQWIITYCT